MEIIRDGSRITIHLTEEETADICVVEGVAGRDTVHNAIAIAISAYISRFRDEHGEMNPIPARLIPDEAATRAWKRLIAKEEPAEDGFEPEEEKCTILGKAEMFRKKFFRIFHDGKFQKVPASRIRKEVKKDYEY